MPAESSNFNQKPPEKETNVEDVQLFGNVLKAVRKSRLKKTIETISSEIGVSRESLNNWESGLNLPEEGRLGDIARAYDVSLKQLTKAFQTSTEARKLSSKSGLGRIPNPKPKTQL